VDLIVKLDQVCIEITYGTTTNGNHVTCIAQKVSVTILQAASIGVGFQYQ